MRFPALLLLVLPFSASALTRNELIDRFRALPVTKLDGLVQVVANCPVEMRRKYQLPIAGYATDICRSLYAAERMKPVRFAEPGLVIHLGDITNAVTNVVSTVRTHSNGAKFTKILIPSPGYADAQALMIAIAKAYFLSVHDETIDERKAWHVLMSSRPEFRVAESCARLRDWSERGIYADGMNDEEYLKLSRKVLIPGRLTSHELNCFASRLYLYPLAYDAPFCGKYTSLDFASAIPLRTMDLNIRFAAFVKAKQMHIFGSGRGEELQGAATAYSTFLTELGRNKMTTEELRALLAEADEKLRQCEASASARQFSQGLRSGGAR